MVSNLYLLVARDLSGTGVVGVAFAAALGMLLIRDARGGGERAKERNR